MDLFNLFEKYKLGTLTEQDILMCEYDYMRGMWNGQYTKVVPRTNTKISSRRDGNRDGKRKK